MEANVEMLGKATQKDKSKGKATFVDFLGLHEAKEEAKRKVDAASHWLAFYGKDADVLKQAANFMIERRK